jgi:molecular chaperone DnaJ
MSEDHYTLLGLRRDASVDEIKKAYRKLAMRHHPDRTQNNTHDTEIFKAVAVAFATLSNPEKRAEYDRLLAVAEQRTANPRRRRTRTAASGVGRQYTPFGDVLEEFFQGWGQWPLERDDRVLEITLTSQEARMGVTVPVDIPWKNQCPLCQGSGLAPFSICSGCRGSGYTHGSRRVTLNVPSGVASGTTQRLSLANNYLTILVRVIVR